MSKDYIKKKLNKYNELSESAELNKTKDMVPGGLADKKDPKSFNKKQLKMGRKVELEHTNDPKIAEEIARDHLTEMPDYYTKLKTIEPKHKMEKGLKGDWQKEGYEIWASSNPIFAEDGEIIDDDPNSFTVYAQHPKHGDVGVARFKINNQGDLVPDEGDGDNAVEVHKEHRRKGIASGMYAEAEDFSGKKLLPSSWQTDEGTSLWSQPNRKEKFGKSKLPANHPYEFKLSSGRYPEESDLFSLSAIHKPTGEEAGYVIFYRDKEDNTLHPEETFVHPEHRRKGLATAMYSHIENNLSSKIKPSSMRTEAGKGLWSQNDRPFGNDLEKGLKEKITGMALSGSLALSATAKADMKPHSEFTKRYTDHAVDNGMSDHLNSLYNSGLIPVVNYDKDNGNAKLSIYDKETKKELGNFGLDGSANFRAQKIDPNKWSAIKGSFSEIGNHFNKFVNSFGKDLNKAFKANNTWYPESTDNEGMDHPENKGVVKHTAKNGRAVWKYDDNNAKKHESFLMDNFNKYVSSNPVSPKHHKMLADLGLHIANDPDRHVIGSGTTPNAPKHHKELRLRHFNNALRGAPGYSLKLNPDHIEITAERHSNNPQSKGELTKWTFDGKNLKSSTSFSDKSKKGEKFGKSYGKSERYSRSSMGSKRGNGRSEERLKKAVEKYKFNQNDKIKTNIDHIPDNWKNHNPDLVHNLKPDAGDTGFFDQQETVTSNIRTVPHPYKENAEVLVKPAVDTDTMQEWFDELDHVDNKDFTTAHREVAYHKLASDFFGIGDRLPKTAIFNHPVHGTPHTVHEYIPNAVPFGAREFHPDLEDWDDRVTNHDLEKMHLTNMILGNNDRHSGNILLSKNDGKLYLIDHGLTFDYNVVGNHDTPHYSEHLFRSKNYDFQPKTKEWLNNLDPDQFMSHLKQSGVPDNTSRNAVKRLLAAKQLSNLSLDDSEKIRSRNKLETLNELISKLKVD